MDSAVVWQSFCTFCGIAVLISLTTYLLPTLYLSIFARPQDLRKKYGNWAVVTGASSGIGKAIAQRLAAESINVVLIALEDSTLEATHKELQASFPNVEIRAVGADLSRDASMYMEKIISATNDVAVSIVFNNAGFLQLGFFDARSSDMHAGLVECNAVAAVRIVHHFYSRMIREGIKGCIILTSSSASFLPSPFATMYGASKSLLSHFGTSLAIEADAHGIDVTVINPSYTHSNLYEGAPQLGAIDFLKKFGWTPDDVAYAMFASVGRTFVRDLGTYSVMTNLLGRYLDPGFLAAVINPFRDSMAPKENTQKGTGRGLSPSSEALTQAAKQE